LNVSRSITIELRVVCLWNSLMMPISGAVGNEASRGSIQRGT